MNELAISHRKLPQPSRLFVSLLLIISIAEILIMFVLPYILPPATPEYLQNIADSLLLAALSAPFVWWLIARPFRNLAMTEFSRTKAALEYIEDAVISFDGEGTIESLNPAAEKLFGHKPHELIGQAIGRIIPEMDAESSGALYDTNPPEPGKGFRASETVGCHKDGPCFPVELSISQLHLGERRTYIAIVHDITERKRYLEQLEYQANHDALTNLPNFNLLTDRIRQALLLSLRHSTEVAVFFIDLDNFKFINDSLGHDIGDLLLKKVAERLAGCVRTSDTVARQGGDEFAVIISEPAVADHAINIAGKILKAVAEPLRIDEHELFITCSIGISISPRDGGDVQTLLKHADVAMYRAKEQGRNSFQFFAFEMNARSLARVNMEKHLRRALENDELLVYYQPKVSLRSGRITGMEALVRWQSPELGMVSPDLFIPLAEETGLIDPIGDWVMRTACAQNKAWQEAGLRPLTVAVNLSARQFMQHNITSQIGLVLRETGLDPSFLEIEITESMVMQDVERVTAILKELKGMGIWLTMDDFGTGYSSLSYLKRFPFDKLKIDQAFVRGVTCDPENAAIVRAVIAMAHSLHLKVIAEGAETEGQLSYLRSHDCDEMQGFYFSRPVPALEFEYLLREGSHLPPALDNSGCSEKTILVVDDEKNVRASLQRLFLLDGYRILMAESASEGFELLANNDVSVVISDQRMPVMTGTEFLGRVKEIYPDTVRILLTAHADLDAVTDAINRGAVYKFLNKPWDNDAMRARVSEAFAHHESAKKNARNL